MQQVPYFPNSKNSENLPHCKEFIRVDCIQISRIYHILKFLGKSFSSSKLSVLKRQLITSKISMAKAILDIFIETKDAKPCFR
jgi:hypothetical protein